MDKKWIKSGYILEKKWIQFGKKVDTFWKKSGCILEKKWLYLRVAGKGHDGGAPSASREADQKQLDFGPPRNAAPVEHDLEHSF